MIKHAQRILLMLALLVGTMAVLPSAASAEAFVIESFQSYIVVHEDASIVVTENLRVRFSRERHGIYREIPFKYRTELGETMRMPITVLSVADENGAKRKSKVSTQGNVVNIRIGDPDRYVNGQQTYVITYKVENALGFFDSYDEIYWNVTGNYWETDIEEVVASVSFSQSLDPDRKIGVQFATCYTGYFGEAQRACTAEERERSAEYRTTDPLKPGQGLTVAFGFDKGIVTEPSAWQKFFWKINLRDNWVFILPVFAFLFMLQHWWKRGRDPRVREAVIVMYEPPKVNDKPLTPAETGVIIDERIDSRDITASVIGLAVKGYVKIEELKEESFLGLFTSRDYELTKLKGPDPELTSFETRLMQAIFVSGLTATRVSNMNKRFYRNLPALHERLFDDLVKKGFFTTNPSKVKGRYVGFGVLVIAALLLILLPLGLGGQIQSLIAAILSGGMVFVFANAMPAKTSSGALANIQTKGFQEFMNRVEKDQLERMAGKDLFFKYLPYAIALDVVNHWAKAFEGIYQEAPGWYVSPGGFATFHPMAFTNSITAATSTLGSAMFSAPRSSGSGGGGGGGFSGGGGGGGGGGSW
jgi:uncharacterized membrane protein YgcG